MRWVITGTNRGIGLELVRQLLGRGDSVEAGVRDLDRAHDVHALGELAEGRLRVLQCDVGDDASVRAFADAIGPVPVDVLVNSAGVMGKMQSLEELDLADVHRTFDIDALGALRVTRALLPALQRSATPRVVSITSGMGSISDNTSGGAYGYRMAKAALNMANKSMSVDLRARDVVCVVVNPGWVQTDMGGHGAPTPVEDSVAKMIALADALTIADTGKFLDWTGRTWAF
jgi:NAD(P)-dependent dehydrogenase (short-subunit alcohol dehydrogenase family)